MIKNILFFIEDNWAFGTIHRALCKVLYKYDIYANILDWTKQYTLEEIELLKDKYDFFVTIPDAAYYLIENYKIEPEKIIIIAHEQTDILKTIQSYGLEYFNKFAKYGVISEILKVKSQEFGIDIVPHILRTGVHFECFYSKPNQNLKIIGYGGAKNAHNFFGIDRKRGHLVSQCVEQIEGLTLHEHKFYNHMCMPSYYKKIDALVVSSLEDAGGLPSMEAACAGRLVISTPVGYFEKCGPEGGGILVPIDEEGFLRETKRHLEFYKDNSKEYYEKCLQIQQYARDNYDWENRIKDWIDFFIND
jgi:glycosyltransferase involved in cell wall biosynthesis